MKHFIKTSLLLCILSSSFAYSSETSGIYISLAPAFIKIESGSTSVKPTVIDLRVGYEMAAHHIELAFMGSISDDSLNQLTVDAPSISSIFYRYLPYKDTHTNLYLILGASQIDIESSYPSIDDTTETFNGLSFGIGFDDSFRSIPQLKLKLDIIRLYAGEDLDITSLSFGIRYAF